MTLIFSSENWDSILLKNPKARRYFSLKHVFKVKILGKLFKFLIKIPVSLDPLLAPLLHFRELWISVFTGKQINIAAILDQFLENFEIWAKTPVFQISRWCSWKSRFSTTCKLKIFKNAKKLSRKAMTLIFVFQWKLRFHTFSKM